MRRRMFAILLAGVGIIGGAGAAALPGATSTGDVLTGRVVVIEASTVDGTEVPHDVVIEADDGTRTLLAPSEATDEIAELVGQEVEVTGDLEVTNLSETAALAVNDFRYIPSYWPPPSGAKRAVVIRFNFASGSLPYANTAEDLQAQVFDGPNSLAGMWAKESRGKLTLTGNVITDTLPANLPRTCDSTAGEAWRTHFTSKYPGYSFYLMIPPRIGCGNVAARADILSGGSWFYTGVSPRELWHELGHNVGFGHAASLSCTADGKSASISSSCTRSVYGDSLTAMGGGSGACAYSGWNRITAEWDLQWAQVTSDSTIQLRARDLNADGRPQAIVIPGAPTEWGGFYYLEWRTADYPTCYSTALQGLQVRVVPNAQAGMYSHLLSADPGKSTTLGVGRTFTDPMAKLNVRVDALDAA
ncbi:MAG: hypothetical protein SGJ13_11850, partial [Actinomycetota bacterium]|nr:hypothetical protein [Actinomycetota bacterium]